MDAVELVVIALAVFSAALVQTTTGFGFALLAVPLLSVFVPTETAVVISATLGLATSTGQAISERAHADRPAEVRLLVGVAVGAPLGLVVLEMTTNRQLRFALAGVIGVFLLVTLRGWRLHRASTAVDVGAGVVSGALNTTLSTNGPPLVMALHPRGLSPPQFRATLGTVVAASGVLTVALFALTGRYDTEVAQALLVGAPALGLGFVAGLWLRARVNPEHFRRIVLVLLAVTGLVTLIGAIRG